MESDSGPSLLDMWAHFLCLLLRNREILDLLWRDNGPEIGTNINFTIHTIKRNYIEKTYKFLLCVNTFYLHIYANINNPSMMHKYEG